MAKKKIVREVGVNKDGKAVFEAHCGKCAFDLSTRKTFCSCGKKAPE